MKKILLSSASLGLALAFSYGFAPHEAGPSFVDKSAESPVGLRVLRPDVLKAGNKVSGHGIIKHDAHSGAARFIQGDSFGIGGVQIPAAKVSLIPLEAAARDFIAENEELFGVTNDALELESNSVLIDEDVQFLRFLVRRDGIRIWDASIEFRFKQGTLVQIQSQTYSEAFPIPIDPAVSAEASVAAALNVSDLTIGELQYRVEANKDGYALVPVRQLKVVSDAHPWEVEVNLADGSLFQVYSTEFHYHGKAEAEIYPRYYRDETEIHPLGHLHVKAGRATLETDPDGVFEADVRAGVTANGLSGRYVDVRTQTGSKLNLVATFEDEMWNLAYSRDPGEDVTGDKDMAQAMIYYHTQFIRDLAKEYIDTPWLDAKLRANANLGRTCNAHWDGSTINFYSADQRCANTGLISDVVYHEWGHGIDANTGGIQDGAFSEGIGDIMSLIITKSNVLGIGFRQNGEPVRDLEPDKVYPRDRGGVHAEGLIIGGTFWDLYKALKEIHGDDGAIDLIRKFIFKVIFTARRYTEVYDALLTIDDDDADIQNGTPNMCVINAAFQAHGLAEAAVRCEGFGFDGLVLNDLGNGDGILEPGETFEVHGVARNYTNAPMENVTGELVLSDVAGVEIIEPNVQWELIPAQNATRSTTAASFRLDETVACGSNLETTLKVPFNGTVKAWHASFWVGSGVDAVSASADALPIAIPDRASVEVPLNLDGEGWTDDAKVLSAHIKAGLKHTYIGDIEIYLVAPGGDSTRIFKGRGRGQDANIDMDLSEMLAGKNARGGWKLVIKDTATRDSGSLESLTFTVRPDIFVCD